MRALALSFAGQTIAQAIDREQAVDDDDRSDEASGDDDAGDRHQEHRAADPLSTISMLSEMSAEQLIDVATDIGRCNSGKSTT